MYGLLAVALAGFGAQLVDGSLGMGYGLTSSTLLIAIGLAPAVASASVHMAEIGTSAASAYSHARMGNVDKTVLRRIALPGAIGAFAGATVLSGLSTQAARPWASTLLLILGFYVLFRFIRHRTVALKRGRPGTRFLAPLGLIGGFVDATGGGGWGPVTTPALLANGRMAPNRVIGTMNAAEFLVAVAASAGFILGLGLSAIDWRVLLPLMVGGIIAAPIGAWIAHRLPMRIMGVTVGGMIIFTNTFTLLKAFDVPGDIVTPTLIVLGAIWVYLVVAVTFQHLRKRNAPPDDASDEASREVSV
jgi:uncharacterized membrane protein YfcA